MPIVTKSTFADVRAGDGFTTGHNALVREGTELGDDVLVGTNSVIDGETTVGSHVSLQTNVYVPRDRRCRVRRGSRRRCVGDRR
ncbi:DapH/DapD/GlmU-related protein [Halorubrum sp. SS7]|uniref:DapH/DapD/GlmU-related protein n=1 Tax=Halorubrum sp. SS7 TaxID=2518119 RepID=UPI0026D80BEB